MKSFKFKWKCVVVLSLLLVGVGWCGAAEPGPPMRTLDTKYYTLHTDLDETAASALGRHMDIVFNAYVSLFARYEGRMTSRFEARVFSSRARYMEFLRVEFDVDGTGSAGMFISRGARSVIAAWGNPQRPAVMHEVLQHEGFHQFAHVLFPDLPVWANEGFAELFAIGSVVKDEFWVGDIPETWLAQLHAARRSDTLLPFRGFFTMGGHAWNHVVRVGDPSLNYTQAWSLVYFFLYAQDARWQRQFLEFLELINRGAEWESAFRQVFRVDDYSLIQDEYLRWLQDARPVDLRAIIHELELLATGMVWLHRQGVHPTSLQSLWSQLHSRSYSFTSELFSATKQLKGGDGVLLALPLGGGGAAPHIALADGRWNAYAGAVHVTSRPTRMRTVHLKPFNVFVEWTVPRSGPPSFRLWHD